MDRIAKRPDGSIDFVAEKDRLGSICADDASRWASAFIQLRDHHGFEVDEDVMIGWFANAIEIAHDHKTQANP